MSYKNIFIEYNSLQNIIHFLRIRSIYFLHALYTWPCHTLSICKKFCGLESDFLRFSIVSSSSASVSEAWELSASSFFASSSSLAVSVTLSSSFSQYNSSRAVTLRVFRRVAIFAENTVIVKKKMNIRIYNLTPFTKSSITRQ